MPHTLHNDAHDTWGLHAKGVAEHLLHCVLELGVVDHAHLVDIEDAERLEWLCVTCGSHVRHVTYVSHVAWRGRTSVTA